jgi:hypothetical protein
MPAASLPLAAAADVNEVRGEEEKKGMGRQRE